jgi:NAD(P)-dependent dehydrogenase (short-subunit alcohol dehydrogenase family)
LDVCEDIENIPYSLGTHEELQETAALVEELDRRVIAIQGDTRSQEDVDRLVELGLSQFGKIDIVVANAGVWSVGDFWKIPEAEWREVFDVNVLGTWRTVKAVTPHLIERGQGSIILIASVAGLEGGSLYAHYIASKHAVLGLMKSIALELGPHNIRCNAICPGVIDTAIMDWQGAYDMMAGGEGLGNRSNVTNGGRAYALLKGRGMLAPQATSNAVLWLASDDSYEVTGLELTVDAGHMLLPGLNPAHMADIAAEEAAVNDPTS